MVLPTDYEELRRRNEKEYGEGVSRYGPTLLEQNYADPTHFIFEILQNAEDAGATYVHFDLCDDRLEILHDGELFNRRDVVGICGLVEGTKEDNLTTIGRFGIGFKSVYAYTHSPEVHSGDEHFQIRDYVHPYNVPSREIPPGETLFVLPFDKPDVQAERAVDEIQERLRHLSPENLLFLRNITEVSWARNGQQRSTRRRVTEQREACIQTTLTNTDGVKEGASHWLVFRRPVQHPDQADAELQVELAFSLGRDPGAKTESLQPVQDSRLVVVFPTEKETHLGFLVQGPYRTTSTRENVPEHDDWNLKLIDETTELLVDALEGLRDMGLLTPQALRVLPLRVLDLAQDSMFRPFFREAQSALKERPLIPTHDGDHAPAGTLKLSRSADLPDLLAGDLLSELYESDEPLRFVSTEITRDKAPDVWHYFRYQLRIDEIRPESFARQLSESFLQRRSDAWFIQFYRFLRGQPTLWQDSSVLRSKPIIRREGGDLARPFNEAGRPTTYLPPEGGTEFEVVRRTIVADGDARAFLEAMGLDEPDRVSEIIEYLLPRYERGEVAPEDEEAHQQHLTKTLEILANAPAKRREALIDAIASTPMLLGRNAESPEVEFCRPRDLHVPNDGLETYFQGNPDIWFLEEPSELLDDFSSAGVEPEALGIASRVRWRKREPDHKGYVKVRRAHGDHARGVDGFDPGFVIEGLEFAVNHPTVERSAYLWNKLLLRHADQIRGIVETATKKDYSNRERVETPSEAGELLQDSAWLPNRSGEFLSPRDLSLDDLPDAFQRNALLGQELGMALGEFGELAERANIPPAYLELIRKHQEDFETWAEQKLASRAPASDETGPADAVDEEDLDPDTFAANLDEAFDKPANVDDGELDHIPPGQVQDPDHRRKRTKEQIEEAAEQDPPRMERFKKVSVTRWEAKDFTARHFLREQYGGRCQVCEATFLKRNGQPYFEGVYLVSHKHSKAIDRPGNILCLCPTCAAKWVHGSVELAGDHASARDAILDLKTKAEGGNGEPRLELKLCGDPVELAFTERHLIDLQELLRVSPGKSG